MSKLKEVEGRIRKLMQNEDRKDVEMRYILTSSEVGDLAKYISHDQVLNPNARPHGTKEDEVLAYGQALIQLLALAQLREVDAESALEVGLKNWEDADWRKVVAEGTKVRGIIACPGYAVGEAYVISSSKELDDMPEQSILVAPYATPDIANYLDKVAACVTDHGGFTCHLANVSRGKGVPCIVGTGNATSIIKSGYTIHVDATGDRGEVTYASP